MNVIEILTIINSCLWVLGCVGAVLKGMFYCYETGTFPLKEDMLDTADDLQHRREERHLHDDKTRTASEQTQLSD